MQLNEIIRRLRRSKEWNQQNLADELGIHITTLIRYEKDSSAIPLKEVEKLASIFKMSPSELLAWDGENKLEAVREVKTEEKLEMLVASQIQNIALLNEKIKRLEEELKKKKV